MPLKLEPFDVVFNKEFYHAHPLIECAQVNSLPRRPHVWIVVYSLHAQFQTQIPVDIVLFSKIRNFSNEMHASASCDRPPELNHQMQSSLLTCLCANGTLLMFHQLYVRRYILRSGGRSRYGIATLTDSCEPIHGSIRGESIGVSGSTTKNVGDMWTTRLCCGRMN